jgi:hypothetical protein
MVLMKHIISGFLEMAQHLLDFAPIPPGLSGPHNYQGNYRDPYQMHLLKKILGHLPFLHLIYVLCRVIRSSLVSHNVLIPVCLGFQ